MVAHKGNLQLSPQTEAKLTSLLGAVLLSAGSLLVLSWLASRISGSSRPAKDDGSSPGVTHPLVLQIDSTLPSNWFD